MILCSKDITLPIYTTLLIFMHLVASSSIEITKIYLGLVYYNVFNSRLNYLEY